MGITAFLVVLAAGAACLGLWCLVRFPEVSPGNLSAALLHFGIALVLVWATPNAIGPLAIDGLLIGLSAVFFLVLPPLVYASLAAAWVLHFVHEATTP